jgi:transcriptional regulator with AAA-type ATPase domain
VVASSYRDLKQEVVVELDPNAIVFLEQYPFLGKVRELQNKIERG